MDLTHVGAFLSGAAAVISAMLALRRTRRRAEEDCQQRIKQVREAIREGFDMRGEK